MDSECKPCIGGKIILNRCRCPRDQYLSGNECIPEIYPQKSVSISDIIEGEGEDVLSQ